MLESPVAQALFIVASLSVTVLAILGIAVAAVMLKAALEMRSLMRFVRGEAAHLAAGRRAVSYWARFGGLFAKHMARKVSRGR